MLITGKIDVLKIKKEKLFVGTKGTYLDIIIEVYDTPNEYGNDVAIRQKTDKGQPKHYLGSGKVYQKRQEAQEEMPF